MIADLDRLMGEAGLEAVIVPLHELQHASFRWLSRGAHVTRGCVLRSREGVTLLVHHSMERDEARASGLVTASLDDLGYGEVFRDASNEAAAWSELHARMLARLGVTGAAAFFGDLPIHLYVAVVESMRSQGIDVREPPDDLIALARKRKDRREIDEIRSVGERTEEVVDVVRAILRDAEIRGGELLRGGRPLTIGDLKQTVREELSRRNLVEDHETIISQGRDAGVPHSRGNHSVTVRASVPIVLDIFPCDAASGYFFDMTRTFCVGDVPERLATIHAEVLGAFEAARDAVRVGQQASDYQALVCDRFEANGHPTSRSRPGTESGYVHGLGHGVGLQVHERPSFSLTAANSDRIEIGDVLTIEPGLYYPDEEIGVRIEETFFVDDDGRLRSLCRSSRSLAP